MFGGLRSLESRSVIAHVPPGPSIRGVLIRAHKDCLVIGHGHSLDDNADLAGEIVIPRSPGMWLQLVAPESSR